MGEEGEGASGDKDGGTGEEGDAWAERGGDESGGEQGERRGDAAGELLHAEDAPEVIGVHLLLHDGDEDGVAEGEQDSR